MLIRTISGFIMAPILIFFIYAGGNVLKIGLLTISLIGLYEFYKAINKRCFLLNIVGYISTTIYYYYLGKGYGEFFIFFITGVLLVLFLIMVFNYPRYNINNVSNSMTGIIYIPIFFSTLYLISILEFGFYFIWLVLITSSLTDVFAYFVGVKFGKHKLVPILSPNKTIEGAVGGILGTLVISILYGLIINSIFNINIGANFVLVCAIIGLIGSFFSELGDLTASAIKRHNKIKDFGNLIPGHGGIMDRFDSLLFTSVVIYFIIKFFY